MVWPTRGVGWGSMGSPQELSHKGKAQLRLKESIMHKLGLTGPSTHDGALPPPLLWNGYPIDGLMSPSCLSTLEMLLFRQKFPVKKQKHSNRDPWFLLSPSSTLAVLWMKRGKFYKYNAASWTKCIKRVRCSTFCNPMELWLSEVNWCIQVGMAPREESLGTSVNLAFLSLHWGRHRITLSPTLKGFHGLTVQLQLVSPSHTPSALAVLVRSLLTCIVCQLAPSSLLGAGSGNQWAQGLYHSLCSPLQYLGVHCRHREDLLLNISCYWWEKCSPERAGSTIKRAQQVHVRDWTGLKISCLLASYSCHHTSYIDKIF